MKPKLKLVVLGLVGAIALTATSTAFAAYTPRLVVNDLSPVGAVTISFTQPADHDPSAKLTIYAPVEYQAAVVRPAGTTIGTVRASGTAADLGGALLPLTGTVQTRAASGTYSSGGTQVPLAAAAQQCTGTTTHTAYWVLILQAAGQTLELPVFVDAPPAPPPGVTTNPFSAAIQACLPPPDVPAGTPGRATFGFKLTSVVMRLNSVFRSAGTGQPRWRVLATPYTPNTGRPNPAATVEAQSVVSFPRTVVLTRPSVPKAVRGVVTLRIRGSLNVPAGTIASLQLYRGVAASATRRAVALRRINTTTYGGTYRIRQTNKRQVIFLKSRGSIRGGTQTCEATFGVPCISATRANVELSSNSVRIVIPKRP
jgi:hypothetical protein